MTTNLRNKKIWIFHHYATPPTMNGFTRPHDFGVNLLDYGVKTTVFTSAFLHFSSENLITNGEDYIVNNDTKIPHVFIRTREYSTNGLDRVFNMLSFYKNLFEVTKEYLRKHEKPDYILASSPHPLTMIAGIKIAKKLNVPCICEIRDFWPEVIFLGGKLKETSLFGRALLKMEHWIYKNADALIFLKEGDYTYLTDKEWDIKNGGDIDLNKTYYINNGVDINKFSKRKSSYTVNDEDLVNDKFKIVYTGAIRPVNNIDNILDAAKLLRNETKIQFLIYGNGNQLSHLKKRAQEENIANVKFKGYIDKKYIPYVLDKSSITLLNYSQEKYNWSRGNSSNKLFEYMAAGKPIISTVKMGYSPIEKYSLGLSLEENTPEELAEAIQKIYELPDEEYKKLGDNAFEASHFYDYKHLTKKLVNVLKEQNE